MGRAVRRRALNVQPGEAPWGDTAGARADVQHTAQRAAHGFSLEMPHLRGVGLPLQCVVERGTDSVGLSGGALVECAGERPQSGRIPEVRQTYQ